MHKIAEFKNKKTEQYERSFLLKRSKESQKTTEWRKRQAVEKTISDTCQSHVQICDDECKTRNNQPLINKTEELLSKGLVGEPVSVIESTKIYEERSEEPSASLSECETVLLNLIELCSSSAALNNLKFSEIIYPTITDDVLENGNNFESLSSGSDDKNHDPNGAYLPGSMFCRKTMNASQIESFLNENDLKDNQTLFWRELNHPNWWSKLNPVVGESLLPPVMLSNYDELANLHHDFQASNNVDQQFVLPIFFHPYILSSQKSKRIENVHSANKSNHDYKNPLPSYWRNSSDEELLNRYEIVSEPTSNMKYLGEAAEILLQCQVSQRGRRKKQTFSPSKEKYKCTVCGQCFARQYTLDTHERIHTGAKPFKCPHCDICFRQSGTRRNHVRAVHAKERPFVCEYCGKTFAHKSSITVHIRIHTNEKPHQCQTCKRTFTDRATCSKHQTTHSGAKPYKCKVCSKCFSQKSNLKRHFQNIHEDRET